MPHIIGWIITKEDDEPLTDSYGHVLLFKCRADAIRTGIIEGDTIYSVVRATMPRKNIVPRKKREKKQ